MLQWLPRGVGSTIWKGFGGLKGAAFTPVAIGCVSMLAWNVMSTRVFPFLEIF
jgi:hypothetical protein